MVEDGDCVVGEGVDTALEDVCGVVWPVEVALSPTSIDILSVLGADDVSVTAVLSERSSHSGTHYWQL